jgi:hypothetical protein
MLDWLTDEDDTARLAVYLVTLAQVLEAKALAADQPLRTLDGLSRADVRDAILGAVRSPAATRPGGWGRVVPLDVEKMVVFFENPQHFHVALKLTSRSAFMPLKLALRQNSGLASHWSTSHTMFCSAVRYGCFATERKPVVDANPVQWTQSGRVLNLFQESQEPWNAGALKRRREEAVWTSFRRCPLEFSQRVCISMFVVPISVVVVVVVVVVRLLLLCWAF